MLEEFISVVHEQEKIAAAKADFVDLLSKLPLPELDEIHRTGEIKLAFFDNCSTPSAGGPKSWLECFKGSPFMEQAIALEQEELQAQMAQQQAEQVNRQKSQMSWDQMDQIRLKKRLLELQKAKAESQTLQQAGVVTTQGLQDPAPAEAQGAGAAPMSDQAGDKTAAFDTSTTLLHSLLNPLPGSGWGAGAAGVMTDPGQEHGALRGAGIGALAGGALSGMPLMAQLVANGVPPKAALLAVAASGVGGAIGGAHGGHVASRQGEKPTSKSKKKEASISPRLQMADAWGRELARADMEKAASIQQTMAVGEAAGRMLAKTANPLAVVGKWALEHPGQAGAVVGGTAGAAHGLLREGGGVGSAVAEGAAGAGLGHAAGSIAGGTRSIQRQTHTGQLEKAPLGQSIVGSAKMYGQHLKNEGMRLSDKIKQVASKTPPPPVEAMP